MNLMGWEKQIVDKNNMIWSIAQVTVKKLPE